MIFNCPAILIIFFNRPDVLIQNLRALSQIEPKHIFLACDGPRDGVPADFALVRECKNLAQQIVVWDCSIEILFADSNHGCDEWVPRAVSWFFSRVDAGIILEDDCVIDENFARFSSELLEKYRNEPLVMNISAANFQQKAWGDGDYYFSTYPSNWGWASWARAWAAYDSQLGSVEQLIRSPNFLSLIADRAQQRYWRRFYKALRSGKFTFWDSKWALSIWAAGGISITPNQNLVTNVGFGGDATHTKNDQNCLQRDIRPLAFPLRHPGSDLKPCAEADTKHFKLIYRPRLSARLQQLKAMLVRAAKFFIK